ncbi:DUF4136 domain-containing protein [Carboxylicivirga sp. A043]|uniref:DUF4136 domain-containing protein n=1 Tax=Carboxylicivirga litoralis TaxID=2816963 RepID=UPI0021CB38B8|nr:DUF4136 domain-containing protein [Carboxylicivirga sp. A043]MCU4157642.1 DUF4136 domain-containing protein [Carboxylicivirga sp. A043]
MKLKNLLFITLIIGSLSACKTTEVYSDFDPNAKFDSYTNFMVLEHMKSMPIKDNAKQWLHSAIKQQMTQRGYNETKSPDLLVKVMIKTQTKETTSLQRNDNFYWGSTYYPYGWGINTGVSKVNYDTHTEGTIIIDIIDRKKKELIWQGRASGAAKNGKKLTEESVNKIINKLFSTYPLAPIK